MKKNAKIYVAGHKGLVGSALVRCLERDGFSNIITRTHAELDLLNQKAVEIFFTSEMPEYVFLAAAKVGGIYANNAYPAEFIYDNIMIQNNIIDQSYRAGVKRLLFLGSSCIYPKQAPQPLKEEYLLTGPLEETNRPYALAKIAGIEMCWSYNRQYRTQYLAAMPTNLYGLNDNYDLNNAHVLPALIRKFHLAKLASCGDKVGILSDEQMYGVLPEPDRTNLLQACEHKKIQKVTVWGTGMPRREFMYSEDMATACLFLMNLSDEQFQPLLGQERNNGAAPVINIGIGEDLSISELAEMIRDITGHAGEIDFDPNKPDGTPQKLMSIDRLKSLGWSCSMNLRLQLKYVYEQYMNRIDGVGDFEK